MNSNLSFEEKVTALATIRQVGLRRAVVIFANLKRCPSVVMREKMDEMFSKNYLLDEGIVEKTDTGIVRYVSFSHANQPTVITSEYFARCQPDMQEGLIQALACLQSAHLLKPLRPKKAA